MTTVFDIYNIIHLHCLTLYMREHCAAANCIYCDRGYCIRDMYRTCIELVTEVL